MSEASSYGPHISYRIFCAKCYKEIKSGEIVVWDVSNSASTEGAKYYHMWCYKPYEVW
jgi:hypothetical protein